MTDAKDVLHFWFEETDKANWYKATEAVDNSIRDRFLNLYYAVSEGKKLSWLDKPNTGLAAIILLDQFARNMFRGDAQSFAADPLARSYSDIMIEHGFDQKISVDRREFVFMPLMHSEDPKDQDKAVELFSTRMEGNQNNILHAKVHREIIKRFKRFPYRNDALGRESSTEEIKFLKEGGYAAIVEELKD